MFIRIYEEDITRDILNLLYYGTLELDSIEKVIKLPARDSNKHIFSNVGCSITAYTSEFTYNNQFEQVT